MAPIYQASPWLNTIQFLYGFVGLFLGNFIVPAAKGIIAASNPIRTLVALAAALPFLFLWARGALVAIRRSRLWLALVVFPISIVLVYSLAGARGSVIAEWYLPPLTPFFLAPVLLGLDSILAPLPPRWSLLLSSAVGCALLAICLEGLNLGRDAQRPFLLPLAVDTERETRYLAVALELRGQIAATDIVAAPEIGALGYYCECRILDTVGLVSPRALAYYPLAAKVGDILNAVPPGLIRDSRPEWLVSLEAFLRPVLLEDPWFRAHYRLVGEVPIQAFGSNGLLIYRRSD